MNPYTDKMVNENTRIRSFSENISEADLVWHRDRKDRIVEVIYSNGWMFQHDDSIPALMSSGDVLEISANKYHRIIKGKGRLVLKITEGKKKKLSKKQKKIAQAAPPPDEITGADFKALKKKNVDEANPAQYAAGPGTKREKDLTRARELYKKGDIKGAAAIRQKMEKPHMAESTLLERQELREMINDITEEAKLDIVLQELEDRLDEKRKKKKSGKSPKGLSKAVKKSLDKKADKRCLTRGSVYSEFRKGLAAFLSSGSRKGMSAHQWAHARVNSAQPSKKWATVKKRKKCPKKKK
jgi:hypothetical protein